jgi:hypothetical protein
LLLGDDVTNPLTSTSLGPRAPILGLLVRRSSGARLSCALRGLAVVVVFSIGSALLTACGDGSTGEPKDGGATAVEASVGESDPFDAAPFADTATGDANEAGEPLVVTPGAFVVENEPLRILNDGDTIDLVRAPQGGHVTMVAATVKNTTSVAAMMRVRMRRPGTGFIVAEEKRTVAMVPVPGEANTMQPDLRSRSQVAHVPLCPDYDPIDIVGQPLDVEIEVTPLYVDPPRVGRAALRLRPKCEALSPAGEALCQCECAANYALGKCASDAGGPTR